MFAKVFSQILDSSLAEDYRVRFVFEDLLKLADKHGVVDMTPQSIARRTNVPIKIVKLGISELEKPDPTSRSPNAEGRRITRLDQHRDWGWQIVNFTKYRESATREMLRLGEAERKKAYRQKFPHPPSKERVQSTDIEAEQSGTRPGHVRDKGGHSELLTESQALSQAATVGVPQDFAEMVYETWCGRQGRDGAGIQVSFIYLARKRWNREQAEWKTKKSGGRKPCTV